MEREQAFDDDYLYFYAQLLTDERSEQEVDLIWRLLELEAGLEVLDLACGHGRIANRLAERGAQVTGLDATPGFLELAREDAAARGVEVDYVEADMRDPPWEGRFDRMLSWFTSFGYFDDEGNRAVLAAAFRTLKPGWSFSHRFEQPRLDHGALPPAVGPGARRRLHARLALVQPPHRPFRGRADHHP